ncbi:MAG: beta-N-acetylhexosaminidase [Acetobacteraceae bacterium]|nr:beta-N-acetylhexosaminidase [Acetobacteraceae bacterium]MSP30582.1 beta-N-acetylhexosaminidase [Acetobacteraceae bacterium]
MKAAIVGIAGTALLPDEAGLFAAQPPAGIILFGRNISDASQLGGLIADLRRVLSAGAVLVVDQEGGRVVRLRPPHWRSHPPAAAIGACFAADRRAGLRAAWLSGALIGLECRAAGFDVVCAPVLDVCSPGAHDVIGDRAFAADPDSVARLGWAMAQGLLAAGIQPVMKHAPGHGRARVDSHLELPVVTETDLAADFSPFARNMALPWAMSAHILYTSLDPSRPATFSPAVIGGIVRGRMGFRGVLVSDDLAMQALSGSPGERAVAALAAGCDLALYCSGELTASAAVLAACPELGGAEAARFDAARGMVRARLRGLDPAALAAERERLLA